MNIVKLISIWWSKNILSCKNNKDITYDTSVFHNKGRPTFLASYGTICSTIKITTLSHLERKHFKCSIINKKILFLLNLIQSWFACFTTQHTQTQCNSSGTSTYKMKRRNSTTRMLKYSNSWIICVQWSSIYQTHFTWPVDGSSSKLHINTACVVQPSGEFLGGNQRPNADGLIHRNTCSVYLMLQFMLIMLCSLQHERKLARKNCENQIEFGEIATLCGKLGEIFLKIWQQICGYLYKTCGA